MERTSSFIKVWFWSRNDPTVPADVLNPCTTVNTDAWVSTVSFDIQPSHLPSLPRPTATRGRPYPCSCWSQVAQETIWRGDGSSVTDGWFFATHTQGRPAAVFVSDQCDINAHFGAHNIIINLTFCECLSLPPSSSQDVV